MVWKPISPDDPQEVLRIGASLHDRFANVFRDQNPPEVHSAGGAYLAHFDAPISNWRAKSRQADAQTRVLAPVYPVGADRLTRQAREPGAPELPALARRLQANHEGVLAEIPAPFALIWEDIQAQTLFIANDSVGRAPLYLWQRGRKWAISNRVSAFAVLGLPLEPAPESWGVRWGLEYFAGEMTAFKDVRNLPGGTILRVRRGSLKERRADVLRPILQAEPLPMGAAIEMAAGAHRQYLTDAKPLVEVGAIGLSGGFDSRMIAASALAAGWDLVPRVRGEDWRLDVQLSKRLAAAAGLDLKHDYSEPSAPSFSTEDARESILRSLLLSAGERTPRSYKRYFRRQRRFGPSGAELTGRLEILKSQIGVLDRSDPDPYQARKYAPMDFAPLPKARGLRRRAREAFDDCMSDIRAEADALGLKGARRAQYLKLFYRDRRQIAPHTAARTGVELSPNFAPDAMRAAFSVHDWSGPSNPIHRGIVDAAAPFWADIPYEADVKAGHSVLPDMIPEPPALAAATGRKRRRDAYSNEDFWSGPGAQILDEVLGHDGFWRDVFSPRRIDDVRRNWPDEVVICGLLEDVF